MLNTKAVPELIAELRIAGHAKRQQIKRQLQLKKVGIKELKEAGVPLRTITGMGFKVGEFVGMRYTYGELVRSGFSPPEAHGVISGKFPPVKK